ncbi:MAG: hypothetical protein QME62_04455 [Armatimonadota bacterium]|nr:hypothetical protein [Armatimonadota bacterium]
MTENSRNIHRKIWICLFLTAAIIVVFGQATSYDFTNYDDNRYVTENSAVLSGLTTQGLAWAFTSTYAANWHPLTWISHMLDVQLYGMKAGGHHLTSIILHAIATLLLFLAFARMTCCVWRSAFVAALFAIHPLHVESVAWIAERKDVLSAVFWMLTIWAYYRYTISQEYYELCLGCCIFRAWVNVKANAGVPSVCTPFA